MFRNLCSNISPPSLKPEGKTNACIAFLALAIYLWVLPTGNTIALRNFFFAVLLLVTLWSAWRHRLHLYLPIGWAWTTYFLVAIASLGYAANPLVSFGEIKHEVGYGILILLLATTWVRNLRSLEFTVAALIVGDLLLVGTSLFKVIIVDPFWQHPPADIIYLLNDGPGKNIYNGVGNFSTYLITVMPFIAAYTFYQPSSRTSVRNILILLLLLNALAIFLTGNRMGLAVVAIEIFFATAFLIVKGGETANRRMLIFLIVTLSLICGLVWTHLHLRPPVNNPRWLIWEWGIKDLIATPLTGSGFGRTTLCLSEPTFCSTFQLEHTHNMVLNKGVQMGFPGIAAFLLLLTATLHALWPRPLFTTHSPLWGYSLAATTMCMGVFLKNMTDDFFVNHNALLYWTLVGAVLGAVSGERELTERQHS